MVMKSQYLQFSDSLMSAILMMNNHGFCANKIIKKEANEDEYGWNIMETMGLEATEDEKECKRIYSWWNSYIPIFISLRDGYSHFSMSL